MRRPSHAIALATIMLAALLLVAPRQATITPIQAAAYDGQDVIVKGVVIDSRTWDSGGRFTIALDGHAINAIAQRPPPERGAWVEVRGDLRRDGGELIIWASTWESPAIPTTPTLPLAAVAAEPGKYERQLISVAGNAGKGTLSNGIHSLRLGDGPQLDGYVVVTGSLRYEARCTCYKIDSTSVRPWTQS